MRLCVSVCVVHAHTRSARVCVVSQMSDVSVTIRRIFVASTVCWNVAAIMVGLYVAFSNWSLAGWLSLGFATMVCIECWLGFVVLKTNFLARYIRFGLSSAAFARVGVKWIVVWSLSLLGIIGFYGATVAALIENSNDPHARTGIVMYTITGGLLLSLLVGVVIVSRISPYMSGFFVQTDVHSD